MHEKYYRTEEERINAEKAEFEASMRNTLDFENNLKQFPKQFNVAKCLSYERTFPTNKTKAVKKALVAEIVDKRKSSREGVN